MTTDSNPRISICIPVFNERANIEELVRRAGAVLATLPGAAHEIVFVDDGSRDGTTEEIRRCAGTPNWGTIRVVRLSRNFGQQAALTAALELAEGDVVFVIDGDLQDRPEELPRFLELFRQGFEVVYGVRSQRKEGWLRRVCYYGFYRLLNRFSEFPLPLDSGDHALLSRRVVEEMRMAPERNRYLRGIRAWTGFRQIALEVPRDARAAGRPKYSLHKLFMLAADGVFSFSVTPLRLATLAGLGTVAGGLLFAAYAAYVRLFQDRSPRGFTALTFLLIIFSGIQLIFLGVLGEYVGRIYHEVKGRKVYVVDSIWRSDSAAAGR